MKTSIRQDVELATTILETCNSKKIAALFLVLDLNRFNHILEGRPLDINLDDSEEKMRIKKFDKYAKEMLQFLVLTCFCQLNTEMVDMGTRAIYEVDYVRLTKFGHAFLRLPAPIQRHLFRVIKWIYLLAKNVKKYKWVATAVSTSVGLIGWMKGHDLSIELITIAGAVGIVAASISALLLDAG